jgi:hypothetical protein
MIKLLLILFTMTSVSAHGSTFVGNGGNAGDLDLATTIAQIHDTFESIDESSIGLCTCSEGLAEDDVCGVLRSLDEKQRQYCENMMHSQAKKIMELAKSKSKVVFTWSDTPLHVKTGESSSREVDAIARDDKVEIVVNRQRYLKLPRSFRIALLTHELFHLITIEDRHLSDDEPIGPFEHGKTLLNAPRCCNRHDSI